MWCLLRICHIGPLRPWVAEVLFCREKYKQLLAVEKIFKKIVEKFAG